MGWRKRAMDARLYGDSMTHRNARNAIRFLKDVNRQQVKIATKGRDNLYCVHCLLEHNKASVAVTIIEGNAACFTHTKGCETCFNLHYVWNKA